MSWIKEILKSEKPNLPNDRQQTTALVVMTAIMLIRFWRHGTLTPLILVALFWLVFFTNSKLWASFLQHLVWLFASIFQWLSLIALSLFFYSGFTLISFLKKRTNWDPMRAKFDTKLTSYREPAEEINEKHFDTLY